MIYCVLAYRTVSTDHDVRVFDLYIDLLRRVKGGIISFEYRGYFGMKQSTRNTVLGPLSSSDVPLCK